MSLLPLHLLGSPVLRRRAAEVDAVDEAVRALVADLAETMRFCKGIGLAANQVGVARRVAVVQPENAPLHVLINPVVVERRGFDKAEEGCLSIPDIYGDVERPERVVVEAADETGVRRRIEANGMLGRAMQHEIDHLDGILFLDRLGPFKRKFLLRQWEKSRKGRPGYIKELDVEDAART